MFNKWGPEKLICEKRSKLVLYLLHWFCCPEVLVSETSLFAQGGFALFGFYMNFGMPKVYAGGYGIAVALKQCLFKGYNNFLLKQEGVRSALAKPGGLVLSDWREA